jgi:hypothetical protein
MFVKLNRESYVFGQSLECLDNHVYSGTWVDPRAFTDFISNHALCGEVWKVDDREKYFKRESSSIWTEYDNGKEVARFIFIKKEKDSIYLQKIGCNILLRINSNSVKWGCNLLDINSYLYSGAWANSHSHLVLDESCKPSDLWKVNEKDIYFKKESNLLWTEHQNGKKIHDFYWLKTEGDVVYLKKRGDSLFVRLNSSTFKWGKNPCEIVNLCYTGFWELMKE